MMKWRLKYY
jgi:tubulin polyglutamylase TTLL6/13